MHIRIVYRRLVVFALAAFLSTATSAYAQTLKFKANMDATQEVPANDSKGKGTADLTYDTATKNLNWTITFEGLTGPAAVAHFHGPAEPGKNAGVALLIGQNPTSPAKGSATLTEAQAADLIAGRWYVNVHTAANKGGEIRGQVTK
jgi:CHRD domain-containing protein